MKLDRNGYGPSLFGCTDEECYLCGYQGDLVRHEIIRGVGNRQNSKKWGCWINLCTRCHQAIHSGNFQEVDDSLKQAAYNRFCDTYNRDKFYKIFGRHYD